MLVVLFGLAGTGKTCVGKILSENSNFFFWDGDDALTEEMRVCIREKRIFTQDMRDHYFNIVIERIELLCAQHTNVVIAQAFYKNKNREQVLLKFPDCVFLQVEVGLSTLLNRLRKRNNAIDEEYAIKISTNFETPIHPYHSINNDIENDDTSLITGFKKIPMLATVLRDTPHRKIHYIDWWLQRNSEARRQLPLSSHTEIASTATNMQGYGLKQRSGTFRFFSGDKSYQFTALSQSDRISQRISTSLP